MEVQPRRRLRRSPPPPPPTCGAPPICGPDRDDRISALPDDMLLQVLVRLRCARAAARTDVLSRRWRGLWARLPDLTFCYIPPGEIEAALTRIGHSAVSLLEIRFLGSPSPAWGKADDMRAKSLLRADARLSPKELVFTLSWCAGFSVEIVVPCFRRATSIELDTSYLRVKPPPAGELPLLERLTLSGKIIDLGTMLSRCPRLRVLRVTFRGQDPDSLEAALASLEAAAALGLTVSLLHIHHITFQPMHGMGAARFASLLGAMARVCPQELVLTSFERGYNIDLPCFRRTTEIKMCFSNVCFTQLPAGEFPVLERLNLEGCTISDLFTLVTRCPCLRVLRATIDNHTNNMRVYSTSLHELDLDASKDMTCRGIDIVTPLLKHLNLNVTANTDLSVSISAPMVGKISYTYPYTQLPLLSGFWLLESLRLETRESYKYKAKVFNTDQQSACSQLPSIHVLILDIVAFDPYNSYHSSAVPMNFAHEMKKLPITIFSALELYISTQGHVFGALMLRFLEMHHIRSTIQRLKVSLSSWTWDRQTSTCLENCHCNEPKNWRSQNISITHLEEVEINNFRGGDCEIDFVTNIFKWAPVLKRMSIKLASDIKPTDTEDCITSIYNICLAYPSVDWFVYLSCGELVRPTCIQLPCSS